MMYFLRVDSTSPNVVDDDEETEEDTDGGKWTHPCVTSLHVYDSMLYLE